MHRRLGLAAVVVALSLPGLRASAQAPEAGDEQPQGETKAKSKAKAEPEVVPPAPAEPPADAAPPAASPPGRYVPFATAPAPLRIENPSASMQLGFLAQPQFEMAGAPDATLTAKNIYVRRFRLMVGGTVFKNFEYFFQVDWPNLFKLDPADTMAFDKNSPGLNVQDAFVTVKAFGDIFKIDAGFMLPPLSHNSLESAAKLYGSDYYVNTFRRSVTNNADPFRAAGQSPVGRDAGVQLRVLVANGHVEFRGGAFQGRRDGAIPAADPNPATVGGINAPRAVARLQLNLLDAEPGFFYAGTYHGSKKVASVGAFIDLQKSYKYFGFDALVDLPLGPGIFTLQANVVQWDGGTFIPTLPKERAYMAEVGYLIGPVMLSPVVHFERLVAYTPMPDASIPSEDRYGGGVAFWPFAHNSNVKVFFARVHRTPALHDFNQLNVQWQLFY